MQARGPLIALLRFIAPITGGNPHRQPGALQKGKR